MLEGQWPDGWPELYAKRKYATIDPTVRYLGHSQGGFRWREPMEVHQERSPLQADGADDDRCPPVSDSRMVMSFPFMGAVAWLVF
jgi:hypothetical protein